MFFVLRKKGDVFAGTVSGSTGKGSASDEGDGGFSRADEEVSAPILMADMMGILDANVGISDADEGPKRQYNQELLRRSHDIKGEIDGSKEPFMTGLRYALTGERDRLWSYGYRE